RRFAAALNLTVPRRRFAAALNLTVPRRRFAAALNLTVPRRRFAAALKGSRTCRTRARELRFDALSSGGALAIDGCGRILCCERSVVRKRDAHDEFGAAELGSGERDIA